MSHLSDSRHLSTDYAIPVTNSDLRIPLRNLSIVQSKMDVLYDFLSKPVNNNSFIGKTQMDMVSAAEISSAIHQIIVNGAILLSCSQSLRPPAASNPPEELSDPLDPKILANFPYRSSEEGKHAGKKIPKVEERDDSGMDYNIVELDAVELLLEHVHFCEIYGKGFKRDANLRMHMRTHGNQFKTLEGLSKPDKGNESLAARKIRFSCPFNGCNRNKKHKKFRPLKSVICVKNHFKRSHCPKIYSCNRCNKKSFSVMVDLRSHLKHCGESKWKCSYGTTFSRKDKLFGHIPII